jgi:N-acetyl-gamma-glutamyl-phosphate reductase
VFAPAVGRYAQGMLVEVPLQLWSMPGAPTPKMLREALADSYQGEKFVSVAGEAKRPRTLQKHARGCGRLCRARLIPKR